MKRIFIGLSSPNTFKITSELIKIWDQTEYSHAYVRFEGNEATGMPSTVYHAAHGMVHFREFEKFKKDNDVIKEYEFQIEDKKKSSILVYCVDLAGDVYDYLDLLMIVKSDISKKLGFDVSTYDGPGYICSELVGKILINEFNFQFSKPTHLLTPKDISESLDNYELTLI